MALVSIRLIDLEVGVPAGWVEQCQTLTNLRSDCHGQELFLPMTVAELIPYLATALPLGTEYTVAGRLRRIRAQPHLGPERLRLCLQLADRLGDLPTLERLSLLDTVLVYKLGIYSPGYRIEQAKGREYWTKYEFCTDEWLEAMDVPIVGECFDPETEKLYLPLVTDRNFDFRLAQLPMSLEPNNIQEAVTLFRDFYPVRGGMIDCRMDLATMTIVHYNKRDNASALARWYAPSSRHRGTYDCRVEETTWSFDGRKTGPVPSVKSEEPISDVLRDEDGLRIVARGNKLVAECIAYLSYTGEWIPLNEPVELAREELGSVIIQRSPSGLTTLSRRHLYTSSSASSIVSLVHHYHLL